MRIYYITSSRIPTEKAYGYQIAKMCESMAALGNSVCLLYPQIKSTKADSVKIVYRLKYDIEEAGLETSIYYRLNRLGFYLREIDFLVRLLFLKIEKNAIVYTRQSYIAWLMRRRGMFTILELHNVTGKKIMLRFFIKKVNIIVALTHFIKNELRVLFKGMIVVEPDAVDLNNFDINISRDQARRKLGLPLSKFIVGYTGNFKTMGEEKGVVDLIEALKKIEQREVVMVAVGGSLADIDYYMEKARALGVDDRVLLFARVSVDKLAIFQKAFNVCAMPFPNTRHYRYYMSPLKMFEYMASKRPIISSNLPSTREVLNIKNSYFIEPGSIDLLVKMIIKIKDNSEEAKLRANFAYADVQKYTWIKRAERILEKIKK